MSSALAHTASRVEERHNQLLSNLDSVLRNHISALFELDICLVIDNACMTLRLWYTDVVRQKGSNLEDIDPKAESALLEQFDEGLRASEQLESSLNRLPTGKLENEHYVK